MSWEGHVACVDYIRSTSRFPLHDLKVKAFVGGLGVGVRILLNWTIKQGVKWIKLIQDKSSGGLHKSFLFHAVSLFPPQFQSSFSLYKYDKN
jgi:hypothetical protein